MPIETNAIGANAPALLITNIDADNDKSNTDNDAETPNTDSIGSFVNKYIIPANTPIITVITTRELMLPCSDPEALAIKANMPINIPNAAVAPANLVGSMNDKAATATAITAIATDIAMRLPLTSCASRVAVIINAKIAPRIPTAITPLAKAPSSIKLSNTHTPAIIPMATDMANIVPATLAICSSFPIFVIDTMALTNIRNASANPAPFSISSPDNLLTSLQTPTIKAMDNEIDSNKPPSLANSEPLSTFVILTNIPTNTRNAKAKAPPFFISSSLSEPASLQTPTINAIAKEIFNNDDPNLSMFLPVFSLIFERTAVNTINATAIFAPFHISSDDNIPANLQTPTINKRVIAILLSIFPALSIF